MAYQGYILDTLTYIGIFAILSISLNLEVGFTRLINFGKVAFFAVGAYTSALLTLQGIPFPVGVAAAILLSGLAGLLLSLPTLRLREDFLAIVTIAFGEILRIFLLSESWLTNGSMGLMGIPQPFYSFFRENYAYIYISIVYLSLLICFLIAQRIVRSPFGRVLKAIREDEVAAEALGKNIFVFKTKSLVIGSCMAGLAGALFAHYLTFIAPDMFTPSVTFSIWIMVVIGGSANNMGVVFGALLIEVFERATRFIKDYVTLPMDPANLRMIIIGILLILFITYRPEGLFPERKMKPLSMEEVKP